MTQASYPQQGVALGDATLAPYDADEFAFNFMAMLTGFGGRANYGPTKGYDNGSGNYSLEVTQTSSPSAGVEVKPGAAVVRGTVFISDANETLSIAANAAGNPRIDTIILRKDYTLQTVRLAVKQGSAAATPAPASLTQTAGTTWEIPIAYISVANGFSTILNVNIIPCQQWANVGDGSYLDNVLNNSGGSLDPGDVVINDTTANAVTTTTTANHSKAAGVWISARTANAAYGRLLKRGLMRIRVKIQNQGASPITAPIGARVVTGLEAKKATVVYPGLTGTDNVSGSDATTTNNTSVSPVQIGYLQEAIQVNNGATFDSYALVMVDVYPQRLPMYFRAVQIVTAAGGTFTSGAWQTRTLSALITNSFGQGLNAYVSLASNVLTLQPGLYYIHAHAPAYRVDGHQVRLFDTASGQAIVEGSPEYSPSGADSSQTRSYVDVVIAATVARTIRLEHRCTTTRATDGFGTFAGFMSTGYLTTVEIIRLGDVS